MHLDELKQAAKDTERAEGLVERGIMALADGEIEKAHLLFSTAYQYLVPTADRMKRLVREEQLDTAQLAEVGC